MELKEAYILIGVVVLVFASVFYLATSIQTTETVVDGLRITHSVDLKQGLSTLLEKKPLLIEMDLVNASDRRNSAVAVMASEIAANLRYYGKKPEAYGVVDGVPSQNCNANTSNCSGAVIVVKTGDCNCMRVYNEKVEVEGSADFLLDQKKITVVKGLFGLAASGQ
jgi:hypothetical protein